MNIKILYKFRKIEICDIYAIGVAYSEMLPAIRDEKNKSK